MAGTKSAHAAAQAKKIAARAPGANLRRVFSLVRRLRTFSSPCPRQPEETDSANRHQSGRIAAILVMRGLEQILSDEGDVQVRIDLPPEPRIRAPVCGHVLAAE